MVLFEKDCDDSSDEKNCRTVFYDEEKYLKNKPPPPPKGLNKLPVTARYTLPHIHAILQPPIILQRGDISHSRDQRDPADSPVEVQPSNDLG